jgi:hypothetical protein
LCLILLFLYCLLTEERVKFCLQSSFASTKTVDFFKINFNSIEGDKTVLSINKEPRGRYRKKKKSISR